MAATYTNPENGKTMRVYVHSAYQVDGQTFLKVNKGTEKNAYVFAVLADWTDYMPSASVFS
jgi:hypothetical protein